VGNAAYVVEINVDSAKVVQDKVADRVGALDGVGVAVERLEEPGVLVGDELARLLVGPELDELAVCRGWCAGGGVEREGVVRTLYS
jgi:hypothetical protein